MTYQTPFLVHGALLLAAVVAAWIAAVELR
jgi:hypothetical protein